MWQAKLLSINSDLEKTVDALKMGIEFFHTDGRKTTKIYILYLDELADITLASLKAKVEADLNRLIKLDQVIAALTGKIGQVI